MRGIITTRNLLVHGSLIIKEFGIFVYLRCLGRAILSRRPVTFLEVVFRSGE